MQLTHKVTLRFEADGKLSETEAPGADWVEGKSHILPLIFQERHKLHTVHPSAVAFPQYSQHTQNLGETIVFYGAGPDLEAIVASPIISSLIGDYGSKSGVLHIRIRENTKWTSYVRVWVNDHATPSRIRSILRKPPARYKAGSLVDKVIKASTSGLDIDEICRRLKRKELVGIIPLFSQSTQTKFMLGVKTVPASGPGEGLFDSYGLCRGDSAVPL